MLHEILFVNTVQGCTEWVHFLYKIDEHIPARNARNYSKRSEQTYVHGTLVFRYSKRVHPTTLDQQAIAVDLEYLVIRRQVSPATQRTALSAPAYL